MLRSSVAALLIVGLATACTPTCKRTCRKVLDCGNLESDRVSVPECEATCENQRLLYSGWADQKELDKAIDKHRRCLVGSTCEEIEAGECYDERLYPVGEPTTAFDTGL